LVNTVISLFFYLKIPYYAFLKEGHAAETQNFITPLNLLGLILVLLILVLFFIPGLLMGWINKVNFVF
jgi:NADH-quinone oxidoreductase subunit N